eukprot:m.37153 g.37153  ORF g.37153 m.37153 type:complete len:129 (+) comp9775_c0_seq1:519-905(+)
MVSGVQGQSCGCVLQENCSPAPAHTSQHLDIFGEEIPSNAQQQISREHKSRGLLFLRGRHLVRAHTHALAHTVVFWKMNQSRALFFLLSLFVSLFDNRGFLEDSVVSSLNDVMLVQLSSVPDSTKCGC